jgi:hypothetical protein
VALTAAAPQKKTTELTATAVEAVPVAAVASPAAKPVPAEVQTAANEPLVEVAAPSAPVPCGLPDEPQAAWQAVVETLDGLAADFAAEVTGAAWKDGTLELTLPGHAATAASFLKRPEVAAAIMRSLESQAGRHVRHAIVLSVAGAAPPGPATAGEPPPRPVATQTHAALLREVADHPLVAHARTAFDAAIRKVEPPRSPRPVTASATVAAGVGATAVSDAGDGGGDEDDGSAGNGQSGMEDDNG